LVKGLISYLRSPICLSKISSSHLHNQPETFTKVDLFGIDVVKAIAQLDTQPKRLERISRRNVANCLLKHDWSYRWRDILATFDLKPSQAMSDREKYLHHLGHSILAEIEE
jgi:hypothetical protein